MKDQWVNIGHEEALRPYCEPPWDDIDLQVVEIMENPGFKEEEIEESVPQRKYNSIMGTYMIPHNRQNKMKGRTSKVRPCPAPDSNCSLSTTQGAQALGQKSKKPASLPPYMEARMPSPQVSLDTRMSIPPASLDSRTTTPLSSPGSRGAKPQPSPPLWPWGLPRHSQQQQLLPTICRAGHWDPRLSLWTQTWPAGGG